MTQERQFHHHHKGHLDSDERLRSLNPVGIVGSLPLVPGAVWADLGCGTGTLTVPLARAIHDGRVVALDVQPEMVQHTRERVRAEQLANVDVQQSEELRIPLADESLDGVLTAFVLHETDNPDALLAEIRRVLKPGGYLAVVEFLKGVGGDGPPDHIRIAPADAAAMLANGGFVPEKSRQIGETFYLLLAASAKG